VRPPWRPRRTVTIYTRARCGLCSQAEQLAQLEAKGHTLQLIDIDADPDLQREYNIRVPVTMVDGAEIAEGGLAPGLLKRALRAG
jgi:glutaredoxin